MFTHKIKDHTDHKHGSAAEAAYCSDRVEAGLLSIGPCHWMVWGPVNDEEMGEIECGAPAFFHSEGWDCEKGHRHVTAEVRRSEGWEYAEACDVENLGRAGIVPMAMDGSGPLIG